MKHSIFRWAFALLVASGLALPVRADTVNNTFETPFNYVANGIIGDSFWDGIYMGFGDGPNANAGGSGNGSTTLANTTFNFGYLTLTTVATDWAGAGDDGFFLYRVVSGDFDVSVETIPPFDARGNNFVGLMARAYQTNNSGAAFSPSTTNATENWLGVYRFNEFNFDGVIRQATNGADQQFQIGNAASNNADTNTTRFYRITRVGDLFSFYQKTNDADAWIPLTNTAGLASGTINRTDLHGVAMQVGIGQSAFATTSRSAVFDAFSLTSTNVPATPPVPPAAPSNVAMVSSNVTGSATITWTPGAGSDGSLVLIRANKRIISEPIQGYTYASDTVFTNPVTLLGAGNSHVVYVGSGNSVTVSGLGGTNNSYDVAVFSYSGSGAATVYNRDLPATNRFIGPGQVAQVSFTLIPPQIPVGGAAVAAVTATYTSGDSYDVSSDPGTIWISSDPTIAVAGNGVVTGITNGTTSITATYATITGTNNVTIVTPAFIDNFDVTNNFLANGVLGSKWDGIYLGAGDIPFQVAGNLVAGPGIVTNCDANITTNGMLTVVHRQTGFEGNENDGFFLFKTISGDFQAAVKIEGYQNLNFQIPGLMVRQFAPGGGPAGTTNTTFTHGRENHIRWSRFDEFNITTSSRRALNGGNQFFDQVDGDASFWLLMVKRGTSFFMYRRVNPTDNWTAVPVATQTLAATTNAFMQIGLQASTFDSGTAFRSVSFSHFMLDATNIAQTGTPPSPASTPLFVNNPDGSLTLTWTNGTGSAGSMVVLRAARLVNVKPKFGTTYTANSIYGQGSDLGSGNFVVYSGTGTSVTVTGLIPGTTYYAAVFSFAGSDVTTSYNVADTVQTNILVLGQVQSLIFTLPQGGQVLSGGIAPYTVSAVYLGGITNDVTSQAVVTSASNPDGWAVGTNGFLTGVTNGTSTVTATFQSVSTNKSVAVFPPHLTDNFSVPHNYLTDGAQGGIWDGIYLGAEGTSGTNSIPGSTGLGQTLIADASITSNNVLTVQAVNTTWAGTGNNGFLLWRYVPGDFQTSVQVASIDKTTNGTGAVGFQFSGLLARAFGNTNDMTGTSYNGSENWVYFGEFEQFTDSTEARHALNGNDNENALFDGATNDFYLLMKRQGTTFTFFRRVNPTDPWLALPGATISRPDLAGVPLQVGLFQATYSGTAGTTGFASYMLDDSAPRLGFANGGGFMGISWPAVPLLKLQASGLLPGASPGDWQTVVGVPGVTNGAATLPVNTTGTSQYFRLSR